MKIERGPRKPRGGPEKNFGALYAPILAPPLEKKFNPPLDPSRQGLHKANKDAQDLQAPRKQNVSLAINLGLGPTISGTSLKN